MKLKFCILASLVLMTTYLTVTDAQRSISYYGTMNSPPRLPLKKIVDVVANEWAFAALTQDGSIISWGYSLGGGQDASVSALSNVTSIFTVNNFAFGAITQDNTMYVWGDLFYDGRNGHTFTPITPLINIKEFAISRYAKSRFTIARFAYAVLRNDGSVATWGNNERGGDSSSVASQLNNVKRIESNSNAFAAIREDGSVITWGKSDSGGDSSNVSSLLVDVVQIVSTRCAFSALTSNGDVATWGCPPSGGGQSTYSAQGIKSIFAIEDGFLALRQNGSVVGWGTAKAFDNSNGLEFDNMNVTHVFDFSPLSEGVYSADVYLQQADGSIGILTGSGVSSPTLVSNLSQGVKTIVASFPSYPKFSFNLVCMALKHDGSTVAWYNVKDGNFTSPFQDVVVDSIHSTDYGFVAITTENKAIGWTSNSQDEKTLPNDTTKVAYSRHGLAALTRDGDVEHLRFGTLGTFTEEVATTNINDIRSTTDTIFYIYNDGSFKAVGAKLPTETQITRMSSGISNMSQSLLAFAVLLNDGTVVAWGDDNYGGDDTEVADQLNKVKMVCSNGWAFAALKHDGSVVTWGNSNRGGNSQVAVQLNNITSVVPLSSYPHFGFAAIIGNSLVAWGEFDSSSYNLNGMQFDGNVTDVTVSEENFAVLHGNDIVTTGNSRIQNVKSLVYSLRLPDVQSHFAVLLKNGEVVYENPEDIVDIQSQLVNVKSLHSAGALFVALKHDHTVVLFPESEFGGNYYKITRYLDTHYTSSVHTTDREFVAVTRRLNGFVDEYVVFSRLEFLVVRDCMCELEVHDEFVVEKTFKPSASPTSAPTSHPTSRVGSPTSSPTSTEGTVPTSSPTLLTGSQPSQDKHNDESFYAGFGVGVGGLIVVAVVVIAYRKHSLSGKAGAEVSTKPFASNNPAFEA